jgi:hypothetical protein
MPSNSSLFFSSSSFRPFVFLLLLSFYFEMEEDPQLIMPPHVILDP